MDTSPPVAPAPKPARPRRGLKHLFRRGLRLYGNVNKLDRWAGGGFGLSTVVRIAGWAGMLVVLAVLVGKIRGIQAQLDPVSHGVEKLQRDLDAARTQLDEQSARSGIELERLGEQAHALRATVQRSADVEAKANRDVADVDKTARSLEGELQERVEQISQLEDRETKASQTVAALAQSVEDNNEALQGSADKTLAGLKSLSDALAHVQATAADLQKELATLPVGPARASVAQVQANADQLAQELDRARQDAQQVEKRLAALAVSTPQAPAVSLTPRPTPLPTH